MIQYFDYQNEIQTKLFDIHSTLNETSKTIAEIIITTLQKYGLSKNCISITADNANVNFGGIHRRPSGRNVLTNLQHQLKIDIIGVGCPAHILHNSVQHGTDWKLMLKYRWWNSLITFLFTLSEQRYWRPFATTLKWTMRSYCHTARQGGWVFFRIWKQFPIYSTSANCPRQLFRKWIMRVLSIYFSIIAWWPSFSQKL